MFLRSLNIVNKSIKFILVESQGGGMKKYLTAKVENLLKFIWSWNI